MKKYLMYAIAGITLVAGLIFATVATAEETASTSETSVPTQPAEVNPNSAFATAAQYEAEVAQQKQQQLDEFFVELARQEQAKKAQAAHAAAPAAAPQREYATADGAGRWDQLSICESGGNWAYPPVAGGFSGGIMFHIGTWRSNGGLEFAPDAYLATREQQIIVAERVLAGSGWGAWPGCSRKFGWL